ncbi:MAG: hypothetical protein PHE73_08275 [Sulfurovaceae bacterium]|nr:hypothetical protein [Sulfurovaceae bacterium]
MYHLINQLSQESKNELKQKLDSYATAMGGKNAFLKLLEAIRNTSPHPLVSKKTALEFSGGLMKWNKQIHRNNLSMLSVQMNERTEDNANLMPERDHKSYKNISNMLRTLSPLTISVAMNSDKSKVIFEEKAFKIVDADTTIMEPFFELLFFAPISLTKKLINS